MRRGLLLIAAAAVVSCLAQEPKIEARTECGMLCKLQGKRILFTEGTPEQMGRAHGVLLKSLIPNVSPRTMSLVGAVYSMEKGVWFYERMDEILRRTRPHTPERFLTECLAMGRAAGITERDALCVNFFPELFHCSGIAVARSATADGRVIHARVLDYMRGINLQRYTVLQVFMPSGRNAWASVGFASFLGTVTAMNEHGLAMGEIGGGGEGDWDGIPMNFLMRDIMERVATVPEALDILRTTKRTCDYYYVLSDKSRNMVGIHATPTVLEIIKPGEQDKRLPPVPKDTVMISGGTRAKELSKRLNEQHGKITPEVMTQLIKRPVAMNSNLHDAIFMPESLDLWYAEAGRHTPACDEPYTRVNLKMLLQFYRKNRNAK